MTEPAGLRVLMTADCVGGVWTYAVDLARGLAAKGITTTLAVLGPSPALDQRAAAASVPGLTLVDTGLPLDWTAESPDGIRAAGHAIADLARTAEVDLVHLNSPALAAEAAFAQPLVVGCHSCVATWWAAVRGTALPADFAWRTDLVARGYAKAGILIAPSTAFAEATALAYAIGAPRVVHNGRAGLNALHDRPIQPDTGPLYLPGRTDATGVSHPPEHSVFTAGRLWDEGKNLAVLDRAASGLDAPVHAAGPIRGPNGAGIGFARIHALGQLSSDGIAARLAARPIFCSPARYEPFGLAVLEAATAGCALVLSDIPSFRELWGDAALFVAPDDADALARQLQHLLDDPAERQRRGEAARMRAQRYTLDAMVEGTAAIYRTLISEAAPERWRQTFGQANNRVDRPMMQQGSQGVSR